MVRRETPHNLWRESSMQGTYSVEIRGFYKNRQRDTSGTSIPHVHEDPRPVFDKSREIG